MAESPFPALTPDDPPALGRYRLAGTLGAGGMGKVYLGVATTSRGTPRPVAVKVLLPHLVHDSGLVRRFAREAHAARAVRSRRVARVIDWHPRELGTEQQSLTPEPAPRPTPAADPAGPWIATEFLAGPTLATALHQHGPFNAPQLRALGAELAAALGDISGAGLIHRDLKPANIVLTATGPRVIDFGIARPEHGLTLTTTGQIPATPGYAAPEQLLGRRATAAADVFSLGVILGRAATGRPPFHGSDALNINYRVVYEEPDLDGTPGELRDLIIRCLAKDPADRPTATELRQRLTPPPHRLARLLPPARRAPQPRTDPFWRGGPVATEITAHQRRVRTALRHFTASHPPGTTGLSRRRAIRLAAGGGLAFSAAGGLLLRLREPGTASSDTSSPDTASPGAPSADGRPSDADPLSDYVTGIAPDPYWAVTDAVDDSLDAPIALPVGDVVVIPGPDGGVTAHAVTDGAVAWREPRADPTAGYLAAGSQRNDTGELLLTAIDGGVLLATAADDGSERWTADTGFTAFTLLAADDTTAYLRADTGHVAAVNLTDGSPRWTTTDPVFPPAAPPATWHRPAAAAAGGHVLICTDDRIRALDSADGTERWSQPVEFPAGPLPPAVDAERGVAAVGGASLLLLTLDDGTERWRRAAQGGDGYSAPAIDDAAVYASDRVQLIRHELTDGGPVWSARTSLDHPLPPTEPPIPHAGGVWLVLGGNPPQGVSVWLQNDGSGAWTYTDGQTGTWRASAAGNRVFLVHQGVLRAMPAP